MVLILTFLSRAFFTNSAFILSSSINTDRLSGIWNRCSVAGVTPTQLLLSHLIEGVLLMLLQLIVNATYAIYFLSSSQSVSSTVLLCLLLLFMGLTGLLFGLLSSIVMRTQLGSFTVAQFAIFPLIFLSGNDHANFLTLFAINLSISLPLILFVRSLMAF